MPDFAVSTLFKAKDYITGAFGKMAAGADKFGVAADRSFSRGSRSASHFGGVLKGVLVAFAVRRGMANIEQGVQSLVTSFMDFDDAIYSAASKIKGFNVNTAEGAAQLEMMRKAALKTGRDTKFTAVESAKALDLLMLAGFKVNSAISMLPGAADLATVAQVGLAEATGMAADMLGALGLRVKDSTQLAKNMTMVNDMLATVTTNVNANLRDIYETVTAGAPQVVGAGKQEIATFLALAGSLAEAGLKGEEAGVAIRNISLRIGGPSNEALKTMRALGVTAAKDGKNFDDLLIVVDRFRNAVKGLGSKQQVAAMSAIFGVRAATASAVLMNQSKEALISFKDEIINASGSMTRMADIARLGFGRRWEEVLGSLESIGILTFYKFEKQIRATFTALLDYLDRVEVEPIVAGIKTAGEALGVVWTVTKGLYATAEPFLKMAWSGFKLLADNIQSLIPYLKVLAGAMVAYHAALKVGAVVRWISFVYQAAAAQGVLNAVMAANPIGAVITALAVLAMAGVWVYKNWDKVGSVFKKVWAWLGKFGTIGDIVELFKSAGDLIMKAWEPVAKFFKNLYDIVFKIIDKAGVAIGKFFGLGDPYDQTGKRFPITPPNQAEVEARREAYFKGVLQIAGAPPGSTVKSESRGAPGIRLELLGNNQ